MVLEGHIPGRVARRPEVPDRLNTLDSSVSPPLSLRVATFNRRLRKQRYILFRVKNNQLKLKSKPQAIICDPTAD